MADRLSRTVGARIRKRREDPDLPGGKLTQDDLAAKTGVTQPTVSDWESGKFLPSVPKMLLLVDVLHLESLDDLVGDDTDRQPA